MSFRLLLIDDEPAAVAPLRSEAEEKFKDLETRVVGFGEASQTIDTFGPDVIVLDLLNTATGEAPGLETLKWIWNDSFCPILFYTAAPDRIEDPIRNHPFVRIVSKGAGSDEKAVASIAEFEPHITALSQVRKHIRHVMFRSLQEVAKRAYDAAKKTDDYRDILIRSARRRVAAAMDDSLSGEGFNLRTWEHYLSPPVGNHLLTGDIIRQRGTDRNDSANYALVLTPSCDLAAGGKRKAKVAEVLVARCNAVGRLLDILERPDLTDKEGKKRLRAVLTQGHGPSCIPLPALPGEFPAMMADFHRLSLIALTEIGTEAGPYERVASVDSPFRELAARAYMLSAARLGLPDRDFDSWVDEIAAEAAKHETSKK